MCSFIQKSAVLMPSGNLNSGPSRDSDDLKVRPLKVKRIAFYKNMHALSSRFPICRVSTN
jgi:hypothetical protein